MSQLGNCFEQYAGSFTLRTLVPGDFDSDGDVDGADFVAWQTNFRKATGATLAQGDPDVDGDVDGADFVVWQTNYPFTPAPSATPVPEPASVGMLVILGLILAVEFLHCRLSVQSLRWKS